MASNTFVVDPVFIFDINQCYHDKAMGRYGYYDHEPSPKKELDPDAVSFHKKATDTYQAINRAAVNKHYEILKNQS